MRLVAAIFFASAIGSVAGADTSRETPLLEDDLTKNKRTRIDAPKDAFDADLDAALGGPQGFSTKELEKMGDRIKAELRRDRPRASPRIILFLYPGRISAEKLKSLSEVNVDIELIMDPCERSVCKEAVAKHIELVGRAVGTPVVAGAGWKMIFQTLTLKTSSTLHDQEVSVYQVPIKECIAAAQKPGGGLAWLDSQQHAEDDYEPIVTKAIARHAAERRVSLAAPPSVKRGPAGVDVRIKVRGDRARTQQQAIDALGACASGLRDNPKSPAQQALEVEVETGTRDGARRFRAPGNPVGLYVDGRMSGGDLWASYVAEIKKDGAQRLSFDDADASGRGVRSDAPDPDDNEVIALLSSSFQPFAACARAEAQKQKQFRGVVLTFKWTGAGKAEEIDVKEAALRGSPLARCLAAAVNAVRLPRHNAAPRTIEYPIRVQ
ncbi:MAG: hypothetical protein JWN44_1592 [Myxococcales bacterium]|nr:hypothetical protein [Myxococcales bacterium]